MRLIDADALRDKLQEEIDKAIPPFDDVIGSIRCGVRLARNIVEDEPTVDAVPVVRCKDCKYYEETDETIGTCLLTESGAHAKGYCSWAEKEENNEA